jgi:archaellum component FlaF (FlaF/FlaG flagellin family)
VKGQVSFEALVIMLLVISAAISITTLYVQTSESTSALSIVRTELTKQASENKYEIIIDTVDFSKGSENLFNVNIINSGNTKTDFNTTPIIEKLESETALRNIRIIITEN